MTEIEWQVLEEVAGAFQAEILRGLLEANEIPVVLSQEGAGHVIAVTVGPLGQVQILVPTRDIDRARQVIEDYYAGVLEDQAFTEEQGEENDSDELPTENP